MTALNKARKEQANLKEELRQLEKERAKMDKALSGESLIGADGLNIELSKAKTKLSMLATFDTDSNGKITNIQPRPGAPDTANRDILERTAECRKLEGRIDAQKTLLTYKNDEIYGKKQDLRDATKRVQDIENQQFELAREERKAPSWGNRQLQQDHARRIDQKEADRVWAEQRENAGKAGLGAAAVMTVTGFSIEAIAITAIISLITMLSGKADQKKLNDRENTFGKFTSQGIEAEKERTSGLTV